MNKEGFPKSQAPVAPKEHKEQVEQMMNKGISASAIITETEDEGYVLTEIIRIGDE